MKRTISQLTLLAASVGALLLSGCGGGSSSSSSSSSSSITLSGVAATGAAFDGASVTATDAAGTETSCGQTATDGTYTCSLPGTAAAPYVIQAVRGIEAYYSVAPEAKSGTINVTPLTTAIVATLSPTGDPSEFKNEVKADKTLAAAAKIQAKVDLLATKLDAVLKATLGTGTKFDPMAGSFTAGSGTGMDKVLDAIKISTVAKADNATPAQITISLRADPDTMVTIKQGQDNPNEFISPDKVEAIQSILDLKPAAMIAELLGKMNTCYAAPLAERVSVPGSAGRATDLLSICQNIFHNQNPAFYKSGGRLVAGNGDFSGIFFDTATGVTFDQGNLEFVRDNPNKDWVISYRSTGKDGSVSLLTSVVRMETQNNVPVLRHVGNQYDYDISVTAVVQDREYINAPSFSHLDTGYNLSVSNPSIYNRVVITSPKGTSFTLKPASGYSYLGLVNSAGTVLGSSIVRLGYEFKDSTNTQKVPDVETGLFYAPTSLTDEELALIPEQGIWTAKIFLAGNQTDTPDAEQQHRTLHRARTLAEARKLKFAELTAAAKASFKDLTQFSGYATIDAASASGIRIATGTDGTGDGWEVPVGAQAPNTVTIYGPGYNDSVRIRSTARKATILCSRQSQSDTHCDSNQVAVGHSGNYAIGTLVNQVALSADAIGLQLIKHTSGKYPTGASSPLTKLSGTYTGTVEGMSVGVTIGSNGVACQVGDITCPASGWSASVTPQADGSLAFSVIGSMSGTPTATFAGTVSLAGSITGTVTFMGDSISYPFTLTKQSAGAN